MWTSRESVDATKPSAIEKGAYSTYLRKNFSLIPARGTAGSEDYKPEHWEYEEMKLDNAVADAYIMALGAIDYVNAMEG